MKNQWTEKLEQLEREKESLKYCIAGLVDDIAALKNRKGEDLLRAVQSGNSWFNVLRARDLLGKERI